MRHLFVCVFSVSHDASGVKVSEGMKSVRLPYHTALVNIPKDAIVVWTRHGSNPPTVHQHQDKAKPYLQNQHFSNRTSMSADALETRDLSLTLREPHHSDSGIYICIIIHHNKRIMPQMMVHLQVTGEEQT